MTVLPSLSTPLALVLWVGAAAAAEAEPAVLPIWPDAVRQEISVPGSLVITERGDANGIRDRAATRISDPDLTIFRAAEPNGYALLILPGGGYARVVMDKEGYEAGRWFAEHGVTSFVLRYRLPGESLPHRPELPLMDAQRAMRWIRYHADAYGVDAERTGVVGFSAGGHLGAMLATAYERVTYAAVDQVDALSARPAFAILMYPVIAMEADIAHAGSRTLLIGTSPTAALVEAWSPQHLVTAATPPVFLLHATDDQTGVVENSRVMHAALEAAGVAADLHLYAEGGHGFGLRLAEGLPVAGWPSVAYRWMLAGPHTRSD
jgi:acetyl esterase/lipase